MKKAVAAPAPVASKAPVARAVRKAARPARVRMAETAKTPVARKVTIRTKVSKPTSPRKAAPLADLIKALFVADAVTGVDAVEALRLAVNGHDSASETLARVASEVGASATEAAWVASLPDADDALVFLSARP